MSGLLENGPSRAGAACAVYGTRVAARVHPTAACTGVKTGNVHCGAGRGNRTLTLLPELDFESSASTNSAIPAAGPACSARGVAPLALPTHGEVGIIGQKPRCFKRGIHATSHRYSAMSDRIY